MLTEEKSTKWDVIDGGTVLFTVNASSVEDAVKAAFGDDRITFTAKVVPHVDLGIYQPLHEERMREISEIAAKVTDGTERSDWLRYQGELYARVCVGHVLAGDSPELIRSTAELSQHAVDLLDAYYKSDVFAVRSGRTRELHRPVEVTEQHLERELS